MAITDPNSLPPEFPKLFKGWNHLTDCLARTVPTQMKRAHLIRRYAVAKLSKGKF